MANKVPKRVFNAMSSMVIVSKIMKIVANNSKFLFFVRKNAILGTLGIYHELCIIFFNQNHRVMVLSAKMYSTRISKYLL